LAKSWQKVSKNSETGRRRRRRKRRRRRRRRLVAPRPGTTLSHLVKITMNQTLGVYILGHYINLSPLTLEVNEKPVRLPDLDYSMFCLHTKWNHSSVRNLIGDYNVAAR
jgi:hypothetical protein